MVTENIENNPDIINKITEIGASDEAKDAKAFKEAIDSLCHCFFLFPEETVMEGFA